ncbi:methyltransferase [Paenibacillus baekrokdamisoli]|uniref:Methyltransferase n=1 Tax=Paenibacillus baekrokdamisoli TaxID=1712516 RepID=A0A3G9J4C8_9BACL|nr:class I SAM-dependent methyltransferase [Paenibacillus baekrokdamisoli]MBB3072325.1 SAM-dependent methyltransferase [Paenibacillus baekrokdamisoli]BBH23195.1 methyltransferase [Paenibacillus baekrokdamisoli]
MNEMEYKDFYNRVGERNGWDFSKVKCRVLGEAADLYKEVRKVCSRFNLLLDIGTGGGEAILGLHDAALLVVGIDQSDGMIATAQRNLERLQASNVRFMQMNAEQLAFPKAFFQIVTCRHSPFNVEEIARVLSPGGIFLTQQVSEGDKLNITQSFSRGQHDGKSDGTLRDQYVRELTTAGFTDVRVRNYNTTEYYQTAEDLIFLLKHTPIIPDFGIDAADFIKLQSFIEANKSEKGIRTNAARFIITARKRT